MCQNCLITQLLTVLSFPHVLSGNPGSVVEGGFPTEYFGNDRGKEEICQSLVSELKLLVNSWFRTGSAYTSNGICELIKQTAAILPSNIKKIFFRADSGFFSGKLFDLLESLGWTYLVKVKLKNLKKL